MAYAIVFSPEAEAQLSDLYRYIAREASPAIASDYTEAIVAYCDKLAEFPRRRTPRDDLLSRLRTVSFRRRVTIAYATLPKKVMILGVFYGGQDFERILSGEE